MKTTSIVALLLASTSFAPKAMAQPGRYFAVDLAQVSVETNSGAKSEPRGIRLRTGLRLNRFFDAELMAGGSTEGEGDIFDEFATTFVATHLKGYVPLTPKAAAHVSVGAAFVEVSQTINESYFSDDDTGLSYGAGFEVLFYENVNFTADYTVYARSNDTFPEVSGVSVGMKWTF